MSAYDIDYNDKRFTQVENEKKAALSENEKIYNDMIDQSDKHYQTQIDAVEDWGDKQAQLQQEQTDFAIEKIEQQKEQAEKDYLKEQSGAYVDYKKESDKYGVKAEEMAASGLENTGYSESSQVAIFKTYQNRVAVARESITQAKLEYDNMMKEARLQNSSALAEIAYNTLQTKLELSLEGFQYKNSLVMQKADKAAEIDDRYEARRQSVLDQINTENALAEEVRQYNASLAEEKRQFDIKNSSSGSSTIKSSSGSTTESNSSGSIKQTSNSSATLDMDSVLALGYGPISASKVAELVASGEVRTVQKGNKIYVEKVSTGSSLKLK